MERTHGEGFSIFNHYRRLLEDKQRLLQTDAARKFAEFDKIETLQDRF